MNYFLALFLTITSLGISLAQRCKSENFCYGYGDPHYIRFDDSMFSLLQNSKTVLLADAEDFNGIFSIIAIPFRDTKTNLTSIDSIQINFGASIYLVNQKEINVNKAIVTLPFSDANININLDAGTIKVDSAQFFLTFGNGFTKLVSCTPIAYGICNSTEADPSLNLSKYLPKNHYLVDDTGFDCPDGFTFKLGKCFMISTDSLTYSAASAQCSNLKSYLALANSQEKFNYLQSLSSSTSGIFLGANALSAKKFRYKDGTSTFYSWTTSNPDNNGIAGYVAFENCLELYSTGLNDVSCDATRKYACEADVCPVNQYYDTAKTTCVNKKSYGEICTGSDECLTANGLTCQSSSGTRKCLCQPFIVWSGSTCACPANWVKNGNSCYGRYSSSGGKTYGNAQADCATKNGQLVTISNEVEYKFVLSYKYANQAFHIGMYANEPKQLYNFDGSLPLNRWSGSNPDNSGGNSTVLNEACGELIDTGFNDSTCTPIKSYMCELNIID